MEQGEEAEDEEGQRGPFGLEVVVEDAAPVGQREQREQLSGNWNTLRHREAGDWGWKKGCYNVKVWAWALENSTSNYS